LYIPRVIVIYLSITISQDNIQFLDKNQVVFIIVPEEKHGYFVKIEYGTGLHDNALNITATSQLGTAVMSSVF